MPGWLSAGCSAGWDRVAPHIPVEEKFGELRIAVATEDPALRARHGLAIGWARKQSRRTCQLCGGYASPNDDGLRPGRPTRLCPDCKAFLDKADAADRSESEDTE
ncbi:hypothetical protein GCM10009551_064680 [Nocardiopsis tropica]